MPRSAVTYVYKDYGANYFGDFQIDFEVEITASQSDGLAVFALGNTAGTFDDLLTANSGLVAAMDNSGGNLRLYVQSIPSAAQLSNLSGSTMPLRYARFTRSGTTLTFTTYSDSGRTSQVATVSTTCSTTLFRYLMALTNRDSTGSAYISGYHQNIEL
jgi:hypothetical protein